VLVEWIFVAAMAVAGDKEIHRADEHAMATPNADVDANRPAQSDRATSDTAVDDAVRFVRDQARERQLVLLGEKHGTREIPQFVAALIRRDSADRPVRLALEIPRSEQAAIERFLHSNGDPSARAALRSGSFWNVHDMQHDGRRNEDAIDLIDGVRLLRRRGRDVAIVALDVPIGEEVGSDARDPAMASALRDACKSNSGARIIALTGNVHAMRGLPSYAPPEMQKPMGAYLADLDPLSVNIDARSGQYWACRERCGPVDVLPGERKSQRLDDGAYDLMIVLPRFSVARLLQ
jgi:erythromycin esterase-like protein